MFDSEFVFKNVNPRRNVHVTESELAPFKIWIDADACPVALKEIVFKAAKRLRIQTVLVSNAQVRIPSSELFSQILVPSGADKADKKIIEKMEASDLVITADVPLAAEVVKKGGMAIGPRGEAFDDRTIGERLAVRNMMEQVRAAGVETGGPKPLSQKDIQAFANQLDRMLTRKSNGKQV